MKRKRKKNDESRKNLSFVKINERRVETLQSIKHDKIRKFSHSDRTFESERKSFENENDFDYFFHRNNNLFFELTVNFLFLEISFVKISTETYISEYHLHRSDSDIRIRAIRHFSIEHRTERTSFVFENKKIKHAFNSFFQTVQTESFIILTSQVIRVSSRF